MFNKIIHFIKYNNAAVIILAVVLILGGGALAAGPENIGQKQTSLEGLDNTALLAVDLAAFNMDFKIEKIEQDEKYYYVTYSFLDLALADGVWQYQLSQKTQKVSQKIKQDIGEYTAKFMAKHYEARLRELKRARAEAETAGAQTRVEVTEYTGLIGKTLDLAAKVFPGYEPVVKRELPAPEFIIPQTPFIKGAESNGADNLTKIYNDYVAAHPEIFNPPADAASSAPDSTIPADAAAPEAPADSAGSPPAAPEPASVEIINLPAPETPAPVPAAPTENAAPADSAPAPAESAPAAQ